VSVAPNSRMQPTNARLLGAWALTGDDAGPVTETPERGN
jgi:hypothetical protein